MQYNSLLNNKAAFKNNEIDAEEISNNKYSKDVLEYCYLLYGRCADELEEDTIKEVENWLKDY